MNKYNEAIQAWCECEWEYQGLGIRGGGGGRVVMTGYGAARRGEVRQGKARDWLA